MACGSISCSAMPSSTSRSRCAIPAASASTEPATYRAPKGMSSNHHANAAEAIRALHYQGANLTVAEHWLRCWRRNQPPRMTGFHTGAIWELKPAMMFCRVVRGESLTCIHAGALLRVALGFDASNRDLLALVAKDQHAERLDWAWRITEGACTVLFRQFTSHDGHSGMAQ